MIPAVANPEQPARLRHRLFMSYSRRNRSEADQLVAALEQRGLPVWIDRIDIPLTADFVREIEDAIVRAEMLVFLLAPSSIQSRMCLFELNTALELGKRIAPVELAPPGDSPIPDGIRRLNWIDFSPARVDATAAAIEAALVYDQEYVRGHTQLLWRAKQWQSHGRRRAELLRGGELLEVEAWLNRSEHFASSPPRSPVPTELQLELISRSQAHRQHVRSLAGLAVASTLVASCTGVWLLGRWQLSDATDRLRAEAAAIVGALDGPGQDDALARAIVAFDENQRFLGAPIPAIINALFWATERARVAARWSLPPPRLTDVLVSDGDGTLVALLEVEEKRGEAGQPIAASLSPSSGMAAKPIIAPTSWKEAALCPSGLCVLVLRVDEGLSLLGLDGNSLADLHSATYGRPLTADISRLSRRIFIGTDQGWVLEAHRDGRVTPVVQLGSPIISVVTATRAQRLMAVASVGTAWSVNLENSKATTFPGKHLDGGHAFALEPDGVSFLVAKQPGQLDRVRLDAEDAVLVARVGNQRIDRIVVDPTNGNIVSTDATQGLLYVVDKQGNRMFAGALYGGIRPMPTFTPSGQLLVASGFDRSLRLLDLSTASPPVDKVAEGKGGSARVAFCRTRPALAWANDEGHLGIESNGLAAEFDLASGGVRRLLCLDDGSVLVLTQEKLVISGRDDRRQGKLHGLPATIQDIAANGGSILAVTADAVWQLHLDGSHTRRGPTPFESAIVAAAPDGRTIAIGGRRNGSIAVMKLGGSPTTVIQAHRGPVLSIAFLPNGRLVSGGAPGGPDRTSLSVWAQDGRRLSGVAAHPTLVTAVAATSDGRLILSAGTDGKLRAWDATIEGSTLVKVGPDLAYLGGLVVDLAVQNDGTVAAATASGDVLTVDGSISSLLRRSCHRLGSAVQDGYKGSNLGDEQVWRSAASVCSKASL